MKTVKKKKKHRLKKKTRRKISILTLILILLIIISFIADVPEQVLKYKYKMQYVSTVLNYSDKYDVDAYLIYAIIKAESNFDEDAISNKGAMGLMQVTESTGAWICDQIDLNISSTQDYFKPEININLGAWYIKHLTQVYNGNLTNAVAAYNAGRGNVDMWLSNPKYSKDGINLDKIPFDETNNYVKKVFSYYNKYTELYGKI